jgi:hypothetical protein
MDRDPYYAHFHSPYMQPAALLPRLQQRYEEADLGHRFDAWRNIRTWAFDLERDLDDFHEAVRQRLPTLRCAECVGEAMWTSEGRAIDLIQRELAGIDLAVVWPVQWAIAKNIGIYIGGGIVLGASVGAIIGTFFDGAGGVPGAVGGASAGTEIGTWLLGVVGIKCLAEHIGKTVPEMADQYARGFAFAWHAGELDLHRSLEISRQMHSAAEGFARGHLLLVTAILSAIALYLSRDVAGKARLYADLRQSKLGPKFAEWLAGNEDRLVRHPALQP